MRYFLSLLLSISIPFEIFAQIELVSLLPNPKGDDTLGEYIEVRNTGCEKVDISGYRLSDLSGKTYIIPNGSNLESRSNKKFLSSETKISLNNSGDEAVFLKNASGEPVDEYRYSGTQKDDIVLTISYTDSNCTQIGATGSSFGSGAHIDLGVSTGMIYTGVLAHTGESISPSSIGASLHTTSPSSSGAMSTGSLSYSGISNSSGVLVDAPSGMTLSGSTTPDIGTGSIGSASTGSLSISGSTVSSGSVVSSSSGSLSYIETGSLTPLELSYSDTDRNNKIDTLEIVYPYALTGTIYTGAIYLSSRSGGLSTEKIDTASGYIWNGSLSGNTLILSIREGDLEKISLKINNTTSSDLRLKSSGDLGFRSLGGQIPEDFYLTKSFTDYKKVYPKIPPTSEPISSSLSGETLSGSLSTGATIVLIDPFPEIFLTLQHPSNAILSGGILTCDGVDTCRANITFEPIFTGSYLAKDYTCDIRTREKQSISCNPDTFYFSRSDTIDLTLKKKSTGETRTIIWNLLYREKPEPILSVGNTGSLSILPVETPKVPIYFPDIALTLQSPTNMTLSGDTFVCTTTDCRANITLEPLFSSGYSMKDYICRFGTGEILEIDTDCNPSTFYFAHSGVLIVELVSRISPLESMRQVYTIEKKTITLSGVRSSQVVPSTTLSDTTKPIAVLEFDGKEKEYYEKIGDYELNCYTLTCSINWTAEDSYDPSGERVRFLWIYGPNDISTSRDPGTRRYPLGEHRMTLRVIDTSGNYDEITYFIHVLGPREKVKKSEKKESSKKSDVTKKQFIAASLTPEKRTVKKIKMAFFSPPALELQGKTGKKIGEERYICEYKKKKICSFNLKLTDTIKGYTYTWKLDKKEVFEGKNPKAWKLTPGRHTIEIETFSKGATIASHKQSIIVDVISAPKKTKTPKIKKPKKQKTSKNTSSILIPEAQASSGLGASGEPTETRDLSLIFFSGICFAYILYRRKKSNI